MKTDYLLFYVRMRRATSVRLEVCEDGAVAHGPRQVVVLPCAGEGLDVRLYVAQSKACNLQTLSYEFSKSACSKLVRNCCAL